MSLDGATLFRLQPVGPAAVSSCYDGRHGRYNGIAKVYISWPQLFHHHLQPSTQFMRFLLKLILSIVVFIVGGGIATVIGQATGHTKGPGPIGFILFIGVFAAIRAIWKYKPDNVPNTTADNEKLVK